MTAAPPVSGPRRARGTDRAAALVLAAAQELGGPPDGVHGGPDGPTGSHGTDGAVDPAHAWRDAAVVAAVSRAWRRGDAEAVRAVADAFDDLLVLVPRHGRDGVELHPVGAAERRRRGSFATPPPLADLLARHALPDRHADPVSGPGLRIVDPACGAGALLRAAFARLLRFGAGAGQAVAGLYGLDDDPAAVAVCRAVLAVDAAEAGHACTPDDFARTVRVGDALLGPVPGGATAPGGPAPGAEPLPGLAEPLPGLAEPLPGLAEPAGKTGGGFAWHVEFDEVLAVPGLPTEPVTGWRGGFDAVLANPPWERLKVTGRDWDGAPPLTLRRERARAARTLREAGRHPLTGVGELNAYLPFVETCWRLLAPGGRAGIVVPAGVASDRSAARLLEALLEAGSLERLHLFDPRAVRFPGVTSRLGVAVLALRSGSHPRPAGSGPEPGPAPAEVAVGITDLAGDPADRAWSLHSGVSRLVNPNTGAPPLCGSERDVHLLADAHRRWPVLRRSGGAPGDREGPGARDVGSGASGDWQVRMVTPLHMTKDACWFSTAPGPGLLPLWEAKHAGLLDHRGGTGAGHRYWVPASLVRDRFGDLAARGWLAGYRNVTTADSPRTLLPCALPVAGVGNSLPLLAAPRLPLLLAALASLPVDYLVRQKHAGANLNFFKLEQAAVPAPQDYDRPAPWTAGGRLGDWVLERFAAAVAWADDLGGLAAELDREGVPRPGGLRSDDPGTGRREALADLDAAHAVLLGWTRPDLHHVLSTFTALRAREHRSHGRFLTAELVLAAYDRLTGRG